MKATPQQLTDCLPLLEELHELLNQERAAIIADDAAAIGLFSGRKAQALKLLATRVTAAARAPTEATTAAQAQAAQLLKTVLDSNRINGHILNTRAACKQSRLAQLGTQPKAGYGRGGAQAPSIAPRSWALA